MSTHELNLRRNLQTAKYRSHWHIEEYQRTRRHENLVQACSETCRALQLVRQLKQIKETA